MASQSTLKVAFKEYPQCDIKEYPQCDLKEYPQSSPAAGAAARTPGRGGAVPARDSRERAQVHGQRGLEPGACLDPWSRVWAGWSALERAGEPGAGAHWTGLEWTGLVE